MTTQPQPAPIDIEELELQLIAPTDHSQEFRCMRCREEYSLTSDNAEPSRFCDSCAHEVAEDVAPLLLAELRAHRERGAQASAAEVERLRAELVDLTERANPTCGSGAEHAGITRGCGRPLVWSLERVSDPRAAIRCADCLMVFCIGCAKRHFGKSTTVSEEQLAEDIETIANVIRSSACLVPERLERFSRITAALTARWTR